MDKTQRLKDFIGICLKKDANDLSDIGNIPLAKLAILCQDPSILTRVISIATNQGIMLGQERAHKFYRQMFAGQTEQTIKN